MLTTSDLFNRDLVSYIFLVEDYLSTGNTDSLSRLSLLNLSKIEHHPIYIMYLGYICIIPGELTEIKIDDSDTVEWILDGIHKCIEQIQCDHEYIQIDHIECYYKTMRVSYCLECYINIEESFESSMCENMDGLSLF